MPPPDRLAQATFSSYQAQTPGQTHALRAARRFARDLRTHTPSLARRARQLFKGEVAPPRRGLYLVGPVGTGKSHLLAATYHALTPGVPCAFMHSSSLFRVQERPERFAERLADKCRVLCLDEVELDDAANEARLAHTLRTLGRLGVALMATSNVRPGQFLSSQVGPGRFEHFLHATFEEEHEVVFVGGEDYRARQEAPGRAWIGPAGEADARLRRAYEADARQARWLPFGALLRAATEAAHEALIDELAEAESLYIAGIAIEGTDDALRLLRIIDALHWRPDAPVLYFSAEAMPEDWFDAEARRGLEKGIAEKFRRTTSRLRALCRIERVEAADVQR